MAELELIVIASNTLVVFATFLATLYRIKIERDQIKTVKQEIKATECLDAFRTYIKAERDSITNMNREELVAFLDYLENLGKC